MIINKASKTILLALFPIVFFFLGMGTGETIAMKKNHTYSNDNLLFFDTEISQDLDLDIFWETWSVLKNMHYDSTEFDKEQMVYGAAAGLADAVNDPHTIFFPPQESHEFENEIEGKLEGIGVEVILNDGLLTVESVLKGSPAKAAGLMPKDIIYKIEDEFTTEMGFFEAISKIRGEKGSFVKISIIRPDEEISEPMEFEVERDTLQINSLEFEWLENDIVLVTIAQFTDETDDEFNKIVLDLLAKDTAGIILDLRFNPGGYMDTAINITNEFVKGDVMILRELNQGDQVYSAQKRARLADIPLVVLVNRGSASASEIIAGAIQDLDRGKIIGETTYGKGTVQQHIPLSNGSSIKLTIGKWFTANDRDINEIGVVPDIEVEYTEEDFTNNRDPQLDRAVEFLKNGS